MVLARRADPLAPHIIVIHLSNVAVDRCRGCAGGAFYLASELAFEQQFRAHTKLAIGTALPLCWVPRPSGPRQRHAFYEPRHALYPSMNGEMLEFQVEPSVP